MCLDVGESEVLLNRHSQGDYGDISLADQCVNDQIILEGGPITSIYRSRKGFQIIVVTENGQTVIGLNKEGSLYVYTR